jgi:hypothetical protein
MPALVHSYLCHSPSHLSIPMLFMGALTLACPCACTPPYPSFPILVCPHPPHLSVPTIALVHLCMPLSSACAHTRHCSFVPVLALVCTHLRLCLFVCAWICLRTAASFVHTCCCPCLHMPVSTQILCSYLTYLVLQLNCITP